MKQSSSNSITRATWGRNKA